MVHLSRKISKEHVQVKVWKFFNSRGHIFFKFIHKQYGTFGKNHYAFLDKFCGFSMSYLWMDGNASWLNQNWPVQIYFLKPELNACYLVMYVNHNPICQFGKHLRLLHSTPYFLLFTLGSLPLAPCPCPPPSKSINLRMLKIRVTISD